MRRFPRHARTALFLAITATPAFAADAPWLPSIAVEARSESFLFDLPVSANALPIDPAADGHAGVHLSDALSGVAGVLIHERQNYAQDEQLSIRGFGARSTFGIRGVRLYTDGIPATLPDGQGQITHFNLDGGGRVTVMRGPFSALFGNSSGGVVAIESTPPTRDGGQAVLAAGSDALWREAVSLDGVGERWNYRVDASHLDVDGYRDHSRAERDQANLRLGLQLDDSASLTLVANSFYSPEAQDPFGLTAQQVRENPRQVASAAIQYDTRKSVRQNQLGAIYEKSLGDADALRLMAYGGHRDILQFLGIPAASQANPLSAGGVVDLGTDYGGFDARLTHEGALFDRPLQLSVGVASDDERQARRGYENFIGGDLGVQGALRRDQRDRIRGVDEYAQAKWDVAERWSVLAGARHSDVRFRSRDRYISASNPDDSGSAIYAATAPVAALEFRASDPLRFYVSVGRGFETPTANELAYRAGGETGLADDLVAAKSWNREAGMKWRGDSGLSLEATAFRSDTRDELAVLSNVGGRSTYQNVPRTQRRGVELSAAGSFAEHWQWRAAWTHLDARFVSGFSACSGTPCSVPNTPIAAGTRLPGVPEAFGAMRLSYERDGWSAGLEADAAASMSADDAGTARAAGSTLAAFDIGHRFDFGADGLDVHLRVDNLFDRAAIGSVIVNDGNGRYFEPTPGRQFTALARWRW